MSIEPAELDSNSATGQKQLRDLLQAKAKHAQDEALLSGGTVALEELESMERLGRLLEISEKAQPPPSRSHWPIVTLFAATLLLVSILLFTGPHTTEIEMDLHVDQLSFALTQRQPLSDPLRLSTLGLNGISQIELPRADKTDARTLLAQRDFGSSISLTALPNGDLSFPELVLPGHSRVVLQKADQPLQYRLTLPTQSTSFTADVNGLTRVSSIAGQEQSFNFLSPKSVVFKPQDKQIDLDLTFLTLPQKLSPLSLTVQDLSLIRIDDRRGIEGLPVRRVSTILSGTLYFEDLNGKKLSLRPREMIEFNGLQGEIESMQLKDDITVHFRGRVHGLVSGPEGIRRSLMPTWLEWLKARQGLSLLWGSAIYLFGLAAAVLRWLGGSE